MTKKKDKEVIRKGNELADKLIEVLRKELGEESPTSITVYAAAKFSASVLYGVRKLTEDDAAVKVFFYAVSSFLGDEIESSDIQAVLDKVKEARQKFAEHRKMEAELDKEIESIDRKCNEIKRKILENKRKILENKRRLDVIKQKYHMIKQSSDDDNLN